jgi:hypothetical protein
MSNQNMSESNEINQVQEQNNINNTTSLTLEELEEKWEQNYIKQALHEFRKEWFISCKRVRKNRLNKEKRIERGKPVKKNKITNITRAYIYVYDTYDTHYLKVINAAKEIYENNNKRFPSKIVAALKDHFGRNEYKQGVMRKYRYVKKNFDKRRERAFENTPPIDELKLLSEQIDRMREIFRYEAMNGELKLDVKEIKIFTRRSKKPENLKDRFKFFAPEKPVILFLP